SLSDRSKTTTAVSVGYPVVQSISESTGGAGDQVLAKHTVSATTVRTWLRAAGLGPSGTRGGMTTREFVRAQRRSILAVTDRKPRPQTTDPTPGQDGVFASIEFLNNTPAHTLAVSGSVVGLPASSAVRILSRF